VQTSLKPLIADQPQFLDRWFLDPVDFKLLLTLPYFQEIIIGSAIFSLNNKPQTRLHQRYTDYVHAVNGRNTRHRFLLAEAHWHAECVTLGNHNIQVK
jgi:hypothetical protein